MKTKYNLFLDDVRDPKNVTWVKLPECSWVVVKNYKSFRETIWNMGIPEFISYDHDLSYEHYDKYHSIDEQGQLEIDYKKFEEKTGYDCCKFLVNECTKLGVKHPTYLVHSMNSVGKQNIISYVETFNKSY